MCPDNRASIGRGACAVAVPLVEPGRHVVAMALRVLALCPLGTMFMRGGMSSGCGKGLAGSSCAAGDRRYKTGTLSAAETELNEQITRCGPNRARRRPPRSGSRTSPLPRPRSPRPLAPAPHLTAPRSARCDVRG